MFVNPYSNRDPILLRKTVDYYFYARHEHFNMWLKDLNCIFADDKTVDITRINLCHNHTSLNRKEDSSLTADL